MQHHQRRYGDVRDIRFAKARKGVADSTSKCNALNHNSCMKRNYQHLSIEERALIRAKLDERCTLRAIALSVQRSPSTISRELRRNGACERSAQAAQRGRPKHYQHAAAQMRAQRLAATPRVVQRRRTHRSHRRR